MKLRQNEMLKRVEKQTKKTSAKVFMHRCKIVCVETVAIMYFCQFDTGEEWLANGS